MPLAAPRRRLNKTNHRLIAVHLPFVRTVAVRMARRLPRYVEIDDLISAGTIGLMDAVRAYDPERSTRFRAFAEPRIRGAMLDDLRSRDSLSRDMRKLANTIGEATRKVTATLGHQPTHSEVAGAMDMTDDQLSAAYEKLSGWSVVGFDDVGPDFVGRTPDPNSPDPFEQVANLELLARLEAAASTLPDPLRAAMALYYTEDMNLKEVGEVMGYTESRACQVIHEAHARMRIALRRTGIDDAA